MSADQPAVLRIVRGQPTAEELAALVAVLGAVGSSTSTRRPRPRRIWAAPERFLRAQSVPGPGAWRASAAAR